MTDETGARRRFENHLNGLEDSTPFEAIEAKFDLDEQQVIALLRRELKPASFRAWRRWMPGRRNKHAKLRSLDVTTGYCPSQYKHC